MIKNKFYIFSAFLSAAFIIASCNGCNNKTEPDEQKVKDGKKISKRNYSITSENSYSTLFLDSMAMEKYITDNALNDETARRMRSFYNTRNYQYAWFSGDGLTEQARGFWNLHEYATTYSGDTLLKDKKLQNTMDDYIFDASMSISENNKNALQTELNLTEHFIQFILNNYEKGYVKRKEMERFIPFVKQDVMELADSIINKKHKDDKYYEDVNPSFGKLKEQLKKYYEVAANGGWTSIPETKGLKLNANNAVIPLIKKRLQLTGELAGNDTSTVYTQELMDAVKKYQKSLGITPDGIAGPAIIKSLNVSAKQRLEQIIINMERMRWIIDEPVDNLIVVNIPEFVLHVYEQNKKAFDMRVVVGKASNNTMMFNGDLNTVVFSPYWNIPNSIVKNEIQPAVARNANYLASHNMEVVDGQYRQKPGPGNALGKVKFLFPNSFNIYFHDTPSKSLFNEDKRAFSHGCIRLSDPEKMANYVLRNNSEWSAEKIKTAMNKGTEQHVKVSKPIPVIITYYTAWVDENGILNFRDDIYKHDKDIIGKMFK